MYDIDLDGSAYGEFKTTITCRNGIENSAIFTSWRGDVADVILSVLGLDRSHFGLEDRLIKMVHLATGHENDEPKIKKLRSDPVLGCLLSDDNLILDIEIERIKT